MKNNIKLIALTAFAISSQVIVAFDVEDTDQHRSPVSRESVPSPVITTIHAPSSPRSATPPRQRTGIVGEIVREQTAPIRDSQKGTDESPRSATPPVETRQRSNSHEAALEQINILRAALDESDATILRLQKGTGAVSVATSTSVREWLATHTPNMPTVSLRMPTTREAAIGASVVVAAAAAAATYSRSGDVRSIFKRK